jgi:hypothetical protein
VAAGGRLEVLTLADNDRERIAVLEEQVRTLVEEVKGLEDRDRSRMRAAIVALGGVVLALLSFLWDRAHILIPDILGRTK